MKTKFLKDREINYLTFSKDEVKEFKIDTLKSEDSDEDEQIIISGLANKSIVDRVRDLILPSAWKLDDFKKNPIIFFNHDRDYPIGKAIGIKVDPDGLHIKVAISKSKDPKVAYVRDMIKEGILKAFSVGIKINWDMVEEREDGVLIIKEVELLETSVVTVPANQDSLFEMEKEANNIIHLSDWGKEVDYGKAVGYVKSYLGDSDDKTIDKNTDNDTEENETTVAQTIEDGNIEPTGAVSEKTVDQSNQPHLANQQTIINQLGGIAEAINKFVEISTRQLEVNEMLFSIFKASNASNSEIVEDEPEEDNAFEQLSESNVDNPGEKLLKYDTEKKKLDNSYFQKIDALEKEIKELLK